MFPCLIGLSKNLVSKYVFSQVGPGTYFHVFWGRIKTSDGEVYNVQCMTGTTPRTSLLDSFEAFSEVYLQYRNKSVQK